MSCASSVLMSVVIRVPPELSSWRPASSSRPALISAFRNSRCAGRVCSTTSGGSRYVDFSTWNTQTTLVDRGVDPSQIGQHAARGDDAFTGLPHFVVDGENPVLAGGRQLPPRVAAEHRRRAVLCRGRCERDVDDVTVGGGEVGGVLQIGVGDSELDVWL